MKIYVDEQKRYEDTKATGQCFTGVGAIGLIAIVLLDTGVIKLAALDSVNKLMVSIVMGLVFLIFFSGKLRNGSVQEAFYQHFKTITLYFLFKRGLIF